MNCFSHALPSLDDAYVAAGTCIPDWLAGADRRCRVREKKATPFIEHADPKVAAIAQGIVLHHQDDHWFHSNKLFQKMNIEFAVELRDLLDGERGMRTGFVGHVLIEVFLDAWLHDQFPGRLDYYYKQLETVDPELIQDAVNLFATQKTDKLARAMEFIMRDRYLYDYQDDIKTLYRINRVLKKIGLDKVDDRVLPWMIDARSRVYESARELLNQYRIEI